MNQFVPILKFVNSYALGHQFKCFLEMRLSSEKKFFRCEKLRKTFAEKDF